MNPRSSLPPRPGVGRREFLGALAEPAIAGVNAGNRPPNIVLILADDLGWADLGCYGADLHETPNIDRLARQGVRFTDAYSAAPVCTPTRASIMTGRHPARLHMTIWSEAAANPPGDRKLLPPVTLPDLPLSEVTLAEALREKGYLSASVGKWHLGDAAHAPEAQGFDINIGGTHWGAPQTFFYPYRGARHYGGEFRYVPHLEFGKPGEYLTDRLTEEALRVIDGARAQPFFLCLAHHAPHTPIEGKAALVQHYAGRIRPGMHHRNAAYAAMIASLDESVGRVLAKLDQAGLTQDTVVVFTSDNGGYINPYGGENVTSNYPLRSGKGSLYEGGVRVPLIVRWPGVTPAGATCTAQAISTDLHATVLDAGGLKGSEAYRRGVDAASLVPLLRDPRGKLEREALYFHYPHYYATTTPVGAVRAGDWKLVEYFEDRRVELYDLSNDLGESNDLARKSPGKARELLSMLQTWRNAVGAQMPAANPNYRK